MKELLSSPTDATTAIGTAVAVTGARISIPDAGHSAVTGGTWATDIASASDLLPGGGPVDPAKSGFDTGTTTTTTRSTGVIDLTGPYIRTDHADTGTRGYDVRTDTARMEPFDISSPYYFRDKMSKQVLNRYLDRAIGASCISAVHDPLLPSYCGPSRHPGYDSNNYRTEPLYTTPDPANQQLRDLNMILDVGAKMVTDFAAFLGSESTYIFDQLMRNIRLGVDYLHKYDPEIICNAALDELVTFDVRECRIPTDPDPVTGETLIRMFYGDEGRTRPDPVVTPYSYPLVWGAEFFSVELMAYDMDYDPFRGFLRKSYPTDRAFSYVSSVDGKVKSIHDDYAPDYLPVKEIYEVNPDITKPETRMFYYYVATRYIDAGCEAIHLGDIFLNNSRDPHNQYWWSLAKRIRAYAAKRARRGVVLLEAHVSGNTRDGSRNGYYYDPEGTILPNWQRQLLCDFLTAPAYYIPTAKCAGGICIDTPLRFGHASNPAQLQAGIGIINHSLPGRHPMGWYCAHESYLLELDHGDIGDKDKRIGCCSSADILPYYGFRPLYGYDGTSWFAAQCESLRNLILIYSHYKVKCLDPFGHYAMPGRRLYRTYPGSPDNQYDACTGLHSQQETIKDIWKGDFVSPYGFVYHNFTDQYVTPYTATAKSDLVFVGTDRMYYIATDGHIHGYVYSAFDDVWFFVNVSYAAQERHGQPMGAQRKAVGGLAASPDGTMLIYIDTRGYFSAYALNSSDPWDSMFFDFPANGDMAAQHITALGTVIFPERDRFYYIARYNAPHTHDDGVQYVYGFIKKSGSWSSWSPSYAAELIYGQKVRDQEQASGVGLAYDKSTPVPRLYYVGRNAFLYYFDVVDAYSYYYHSLPITVAKVGIAGNIAVHGDRVYFMGFDRIAGDLWVYCLHNTSTGWSLINVAAASGPLSGQAPGNNDLLPKIAVSASGNAIAYFGNVPMPGLMSLCYYYFDGSSYYYYKADDAQIPHRNSLQFFDNAFYYISTYNNGVHKVAYQEKYCDNAVFANYPSTGLVSC